MKTKIVMSFALVTVLLTVAGASVRASRQCGVRQQQIS